MIPISPENYFEIYVIFSLVVVTGFWAFHAWNSGSKEVIISEEKLCRCKECSLTYIAARAEQVSRCPRCNKVNNVNPKARL